MSSESERGEGGYACVTIYAPVELYVEMTSRKVEEVHVDLRSWEESEIHEGLPEDVTDEEAEQLTRIVADFSMDRRDLVWMFGGAAEAARLNEEAAFEREADSVLAG